MSENKNSNAAITIQKTRRKAIFERLVQKSNGQELFTLTAGSLTKGKGLIQGHKDSKPIINFFYEHSNHKNGCSEPSIKIYIAMNRDDSRITMFTSLAKSQVLPTIAIKELANTSNNNLAAVDSTEFYNAKVVSISEFGNELHVTLECTGCTALHLPEGPDGKRSGKISAQLGTITQNPKKANDKVPSANHNINEHIKTSKNAERQEIFENLMKSNDGKELFTITEANLTKGKGFIQGHKDSMPIINFCYELENNKNGCSSDEKISIYVLMKRNNARVTVFQAMANFTTLKDIAIKDLANTQGNNLSAVDSNTFANAKVVYIAELGNEFHIVLESTGCTALHLPEGPDGKRKGKIGAQLGTLTQNPVKAN